MQNNPMQNQSAKEKKDHARRDAILRKLRSMLLENWGTKLLAVFLAIALWAGLITQDPSLTREKQFNDVSVSVTGADTLKRNGFIVLEDIGTVYDDFTVRVSVPQGQYASAQPANYSLRVDLSRIKAAGEQSLKVLYTNTSTYGKVVEIEPATVTLTVDEYVTRYRVPVTVDIQGDVPEGYWADEPSTDPPMVAVSGPKTLVEKIVSARVVADQSTLPAKEGKVRRAMKFEMVDQAGEVIQSDLLQVTSESVLLDSIIVEQTMYASRLVELSATGLVIGEPADGYEVKGVYITPGVVSIAGREEVIRDLDILYANSTVDVTGKSASFNRNLWIRTPSTLKFTSTDMVAVAVEIGPIMTGRAYAAPIQLTNLSDELMETSGMPSATVYIHGAQHWLDTLSSADVLLYCDLGSITGPGTYNVPLNCVVQGGEDQNYTCDILPETVDVVIEQR